MLVVERGKMVVATRLLRQRYIVTLGKRGTPHVVAILLVEVVLAPLVQRLVHLVSRNASFVTVTIQLIEGRIVIILQFVEHQCHTALVGHTVVIDLRLVVNDIARRSIVHLVEVRLGRDIPVCIHVHRCLIRLTLLRRYHDYAIGSQRSVDRGCCRILEHRYRLYVIGIDIAERQVGRHIVNHNEGCSTHLAREGTHTTQHRRTLAGIGIDVHHHTCHLTFQSREHVLVHHAVQLCRIHETEGCR